MWIDGVVASLILFAIALGWRRGFLGPALGIAGLVVAWLATPVLSPWVARTLAGRDYTASSVAVASALLSFAAVLLLFRFAQGYLPDALDNWSHSVKRFDSGLGAILGGVRGALMCWLLLSAGVLVQAGIFDRWPAAQPHWQSSIAVDATRHYNPVAEVSLGKLAALRRALAGARFGHGQSTAGPTPSAGPPSAGAGAGTGSKADLPAAKRDRAGRSRRAAKPRDRKIDADAIEPASTKRRRLGREQILNDPALRAAARRKDWATLLADDRVEALLADEAALSRAMEALK